MGWVYLIKDTVSGLYKIGVTKRDPKIRLQKLQTGNPHKLQIIAMYKAIYPYRLENMIHNKYKNSNVLNEWYELNSDIEDKFVEICECINEIIINMKDNYFFAKNLK